MQRVRIGGVGLVVALGSLSACSPAKSSTASDAGNDAPTCTTPFAGDPGQAPQMELVAMGMNNEVTTLQEGSGVPLMFPPQAGRVAFVGVHAKNVDPCTVELTAAFKDPVSGQVRLDQRLINLRVADGGMAYSAPGAINLWANIPVCPNQWSQQDAIGTTYLLNVTLKERGGREQNVHMNIVPYCGDPTDEDCTCICRAGYQLGQSCVMDGGMMDAGDGG